MLVVYWKSGPSKGYRNLYPSHWFAEAGFWPGKCHTTIGPQGGRHDSRCSIAIEGRVVDLDYGGDFASLNAKHHHIGVLRLEFKDPSRTDVQSIYWRDSGSDRFVKEEDVVAFEFDVQPEELAEFDPTSVEDGRRKISRMIVLRQGQPRFRQDLIDAYEGRCAISGCDVREVLEAAHIMPYFGEETNHVTNGLLLRADLHTLFDLNLIRIAEDYRITAEPRIIAAFCLPDQIQYLPASEQFRPSRQALKLRASSV